MGADSAPPRPDLAGHPCDRVLCPTPQDPKSLEAGAFYLDRRPQPKHLTWGGTAYSQQQAEAVVDKIQALTGCSY